jgi:hypothetical protein
MIRLSTLFWLVVVATAGFAMFAVKYEVQGLADELARTVKQADDTERDVRVLDAEWAYLNRPDALAQMNQRLLSLVPIATKQLRTSLGDIPMRPAPPPPPPPPPAPVETVAAVAADAPIAVAAAPAAEAPPTDAGVSPDQTAAAAPQPAAPPTQAPRPESARPIVAVAFDPHAAAQSGKPALVKTAARSNLSRRAGSLDELIAQITESR